MQEICSSGCAGIIETDGALIIGVCGFARRWSLFVSSGLGNFLGRMSKSLRLPPAASLESKHEVAIMYFVRVSDSLAMTSERMVISCENCTLEQVLNKLRMRGKDGRMSWMTAA